MSGVEIIAVELRHELPLSGWCAYQGRLYRFWKIGLGDGDARIYRLHEPTQEELVGFFSRINWSWVDQVNHDPLYGEPEGRGIGAMSLVDGQCTILGEGNGD